MFRPKIPTNPTPTGAVIPLAVEPTSVDRAPAPAAVPAPVAESAPVSTRPTVQLTPGALLALVGGGTAVVLVVGTVLVSMLLAVAVTAASVAVCALVVRSLMASQHRR
ncbi:SpdD-like protein [Streptomyces sp. Ru87]|uniref:SpdD-like protein n=1 Tax=Streptomyces sp. Ru87 TaxID=2044307 RepID=UPI000BF38C29|nr:SpdD-like protein [Streptomyces sp. Ru87]PGH48327.1 SpdD-like protein [Streptomyces sp. Ru87]